jgi:hypothetical protein
MLDLSVLADWSFLDFFKVFFAMSLFSLSICPSGAMPLYMQSTRHCSTVSPLAVSVVKCARVHCYDVNLRSRRATRH